LSDRIVIDEHGLSEAMGDKKPTIIVIDDENPKSMSPKTYPRDSKKETMSMGDQQEDSLTSSFVQNSDPQSPSLTVLLNSESESEFNQKTKNGQSAKHKNQNQPLHKSNTLQEPTKSKPSKRKRTDNSAGRGQKKQKKDLYYGFDPDDFVENFDVVSTIMQPSEPPTPPPSPVVPINSSQSSTRDENQSPDANHGPRPRPRRQLLRRRPRAVRQLQYEDTDSLETGNEETIDQMMDRGSMHGSGFGGFHSYNFEELGGLFRFNFPREGITFSMGPSFSSFIQQQSEQAGKK